MRERIIRQPDPKSVDRWQVPTVTDSALVELKGARAGSAHQLTVGQLDELERKVREEARQVGFAQGLDEGRREIESRVARLERLFDALAYPFEVLDENVEAELAALVVALASQIVRREVETDPTLLRETIAECLAALPSGARDVALYLNPADEALLRQSLGAEGARRWKLRTDPALDRGDLRVTSDGSQIDGRLGARLEQIIAARIVAVTEASAQT